MKQGRVVEDSFFLDDEDGDTQVRDGGFSRAKTLNQLDSPSWQESFSNNHMGYKGFGGPDGLIVALEA